MYNMPVLGIKSPTPALPNLKGKGRKKIIKCGGWSFSGRNYSPATLGYNALLNGVTANYRNKVDSKGVSSDIDRNINDAKAFFKNPNPEAFAINQILKQSSTYGSGRSDMVVPQINKLFTENSGHSNNISIPHPADIVDLAKMILPRGGARRVKTEGYKVTQFRNDSYNEPNILGEVYLTP
jgi:hypothetical protein